MRVTNSPASRKRRNRMLQAAKGFRLKRSKLYRYAATPWITAAIRLSRPPHKKRTFRYLWQARINAAVRDLGLTYSRFIEGLKAPSANSTARSSRTSPHRTTPRSSKS